MTNSYLTLQRWLASVALILSFPAYAGQTSLRLIITPRDMSM